MCIRDSSTYQEVQNIALTATLTEYIIDLTVYTGTGRYIASVSYTHLRAHETVLDLVCRLLLEKKNLNCT